MMPVRIVIMAKTPRAGVAKTRLIPAVGAEGAAQLARRMLQHTLREALTAGVGPVELCRTPDNPADWQDIVLPDRISLSAQGDGDLGERMARVAQRVLNCAEALLLIGTDCPALDAGMLRRAAMALRATDAVLVPATDGGYVALGLQRFDAAVFRAIAWSTADVAFQTLCRIGQLGWTVTRMPWLHDIDEPADLQLLPPEWNTVHA